MVKRVKDMTSTAAGDTLVDSKSVLSDVQQVKAVMDINDEEDDARGGSNRAILPDKCPLCEMSVGFDDVKYYDVSLLKKFMSVRGNIIPRSKSGVCAKHQRALVKAIKRARYIALLPYVEIGI